MNLYHVKLFADAKKQFESLREEREEIEAVMIRRYRRIPLRKEVSSYYEGIALANKDATTYQLVKFFLPEKVSSL